MKIAAICAVMLALTSGTAGAKESCQQIGGTCMEGCEPGYRPVGPYDCFDSVCCVPEIPTTTPSSVAAESCQQIGGTCMEGCEPGYRPVGPHDCFDSVCCVPEIPTTTPSSVAAESCQQIGGTCMEGCEPGYRPVGPHDCFDSVCCVPAVDQTSPIPIVQAIFDAAQSEDFTPLAGLCDPADEGDGDTRAICQLAYDTRGAPDFIEYFQKGSVSGEAVIQGDQASVPILFGPDGTRSETMQLIRREGLWYLFSF